MTKCFHRSVFGRTSIKDQEVGMCLDCTKIIDINTGKVVEKNAAYTWMQIHPQETELYKIKEII